MAKWKITYLWRNEVKEIEFETYLYENNKYDALDIFRNSVNFEYVIKVERMDENGQYKEQRQN